MSTARLIVAQIRKQEALFRQRINAVHAKSAGKGNRQYGRICHEPTINIRNWPTEELYLRSKW